MNALLLIIAASAGLSLDVTVEGDGYLRFAYNGRAVYQKSVRLTVVDRKLCAPGGASLIPTMWVPEGASQLDVDATGRIMALVGNRAAPCGTPVLAMFERAPGIQRDGFWLSEDRPALFESGGLAGVVRRRTAAAPALPTSSPKASAPLRANVRSVSEVNSDRFTLADIADLVGPSSEKIASVYVGETPAIGIDRVIEVSRLSARLRAAGIDPKQIELNVPTGAVVRRKCQTATFEQMVQTAVISAERQFGKAGELTPDKPGANMKLPLGSLQLSCDKVEETGMTVRAVVSAYVDGKRINDRTLVLRRTNVAPPARVGEQVKIHLVSGGVTVEVTGRVVKSGRPGQPVEVLTSDGIQFTGRAVSNGRVEVEL